MVMYFFNIYDELTTLDLEGTDLPDLPAAIIVAIKGIRSLISETVADGYLESQHRLEIVSSDQRLLHTVRFKDAVQIRL